MDDRDFEPPWVDSQPSQVHVLIHQTERTTCLAALKQLGQKVDALSRIPNQRSVLWALGRARRRAVLAGTERRLARVCKAVAQIRQACRAMKTRTTLWLTDGGGSATGVGAAVSFKLVPAFETREV